MRQRVNFEEKGELSRFDLQRRMKGLHFYVVDEGEYAKSWIWLTQNGSVQKSFSTKGHHQWAW
jgi:hypothetical protein